MSKGCPTGLLRNKNAKLAAFYIQKIRKNLVVA
jgi:hypothetical protein